MLFTARKKSARWLVITSHFLFVLSVSILLATGLRIAVANESSLAWLSMLLPQGNVHVWHFRFAFVFFFAVLLYGLALFLRQSLPARASKFRLGRWFQWSHYLGILVFTLAFVTGALLFLEATMVPIETLLRIHLFNSFLFILYIVLHSALALASQGLTKTLRVFNVFKKVKFSAAVWLVLVLMSAFALSRFIPQESVLQVAFTEEPLDIDGDAREAIWRTAPTATIQTYQGYRQPEKGTKVTVQAAHDGQSIHILLKWADPTRSQVHLPLEKTSEGWTIRHSNAFKADENSLYEDKFAIMLSESNALAGANTIHLGDNTITEQPAPPNGRGLHYTTDGNITDVWHWKSVRTGLSIQQVDDNFFGPPSPSDSEYKRYTGGYQKDKDDCEHLVRWDGSDYQTKPECGGFVMNWKLFEPGIVTPLRLPKTTDQLKRLGQLDFNEDTSDFGSWWMDWKDTVAYEPDADRFEIGTIIPSVLSLGPFTQGRGDVSAVGFWRDGYWQLELSRALNTESKYDLPITSGTYIWFAAFDHSQTRHSYHIRPVRIELQ